MNGGDLGRHFMKLATQAKARLFRQNVGLAWIGKQERKGADFIVLSDPRPFRAGIKGMSDLGGWSPLTITADMVGATVAIYTVAEVKAGKDRPTTEQNDFIAAVLAAGGRAGIARNDDDLTKILSHVPRASD